MVRKKIFLLLLTFSLLIFTACTKADPDAANRQNLKKITLVLDWTPNTNHTGLYVARDKGYFEEQGLDVEIIQPGEATAEQIVASGKADFGISYQEGVTLARAQNIPIISIGAIIQHNTSGFASLQAKNITNPKDFEGKTYGGFGSPVEKQMIQSLMATQKADINKVKIINVGNVDFFTAMKKDIDFMWIYYGWTGIEAELRGEKLNMVYLTDYSKDLDYYTPVIITNEKKKNEDPDTIHKFMAAVNKGYQFAIDDPTAAADVLIQAVPELDPELVKKSQAWLSPKYQDDAPVWGMQKEEVWTNYANWMKKHNLLEGDFDPKKAFTNEFLPDQKGGEK